MSTEWVPFLTQELIELRIVQREQLASVPDWLLRPERLRMNLQGVRVLAKPDHPPLLERRIRREAQAELDRLGPYLESGRVYKNAQQMKTFLDASAKVVPKNLDQLILPLYEEAVGDVRTASEIATHQPEGPEEQVALLKAVALLALADALAEDGYFDPRLLHAEG